MSKEFLTQDLRSMRSPEELLVAYEAASKDSPLVLTANEADNFSKAMRISSSREDERLGKQNIKVTVWDRGVSFKNDAVISPVDGKSYSNRNSWDDMLKRNACIQIGNDFNNATDKKREVVGDFNCRDELGRATHQIMEKYGH